MSKKIEKQKVYNICLQKLEEQVENFDSRVQSMKSDINNKTYSASQSEDRQPGKIELLRIYESELAFSKADLDYLKNLNITTEHKKVEPGSLSITNQLVFFVSVSTEKFEINNKTVVGISVNAPIYKAMAGLGKGDSFNLNDTEYLIEELY